MRRKGGHLPVEQPTVRPGPVLYVAPEALSNVLGELEHKWSHNALTAQERLTQAIDRDDALNAERWAKTAGISTEKTLLMKGRPTEIVANLHAHRHEIGDVMDKLAVAARVLSNHRRKGYANVVEPVSHLPLASPKDSVIITRSAAPGASGDATGNT